LKPKKKKDAEEAASKKEEKVDYRAKVLGIYEKHNPSKVHLVDKALSQYAGREEELIQKLYSSFGLDSNGRTKEEAEEAAAAEAAAAAKKVEEAKKQKETLKPKEEEVKKEEERRKS